MNCTLYAASGPFPTHLASGRGRLARALNCDLRRGHLCGRPTRKENVMRRILSVSLLTLSLAGLPAIVGCDRTVAHDHTDAVKSDGTSVSKDTKVTKNADGSVTKTETKDVSK